MDLGSTEMWRPSASSEIPNTSGKYRKIFDPARNRKLEETFTRVRGGWLAGGGGGGCTGRYNALN